MVIMNQKDWLYDIIYVRMLNKVCTSQRMFIANVVDIFINKDCIEMKLMMMLITNTYFIHDIQSLQPKIAS